ncbi:unnamed protein product [Discula destructiva]
MPHRQKLEFISLHPTFAAEVKGVDFSKPISDETFAEIQRGITKDGVLIFRSTALDDESHVSFASNFGPLDDMTPYVKAGNVLRLASPYLFDVSNLETDNSVAPLTSHRYNMSKGNALFHVDSSFNPRRAGFSILRAATLPPPGTGGATEFADTRTAWDELPDDIKETLMKKDYIAAHSVMHSRKMASPDALKDLDPEKFPMGRHKLAQIHEASNRWNTSTLHRMCIILRSWRRRSQTGWSRCFISMLVKGSM